MIFDAVFKVKSSSTTSVIKSSVQPEVSASFKVSDQLRL